MNCLNCYTINDDKATQCRNCGSTLQQKNGSSNINYNKDETIKYLLIFIGVEAVVSMLWLIAGRFILPAINKSGNINTGDFYKYFGFFTDVISITTILIIIAALKNKNAKIVLIIVLAIRILTMLAYRIFPSIN